MRRKKTLFACCVISAITLFNLPVYSSPEMDNDHSTILQTPQNKDGDIRIQGTITDVRGEAIIGATVQPDDHSTGVVSNVTGGYYLLLKKKPAAIIVSFLGYKNKLIKYEGQSTINITLEEDTKLLDEVVVTGYQTIKKEQATGAFAIVGEKMLDQKISLNATSALEGKVAGVSTYAGSIVIRGRSTFLKTDPLIVIDGMPTEQSIDDINMNDVASFTILKDAASTSIYGSRASNGVIVITTKKGDEGKLKVNFTSDWQWKQNPSFSDYHYLTTSEYIDNELAYLDQNAAFQNQTTDQYVISKTTGVGSSTIYASPINTLRYNLAKGIITQDQYNAAIDQFRLNDSRKEYMDNVWRTPLLQNYNISISTANLRQNTYISFKYTRNDMQMRSDNSDTYKAYIKSTQNITKWLSLNVGMDAQYFSSKSAMIYANTGASQYSFGNQVSAILPYQRILNPDGSRQYAPYPYNAGLGASYYLGTGTVELNSRFVDELSKIKEFDPFNYNVLDELDMNYNKSNNLFLRSFAGLNFKILKDLNFETSFNYELNRNSTDEYADTNSYLMRFARNRLISSSNTGGVIAYTKNLPDGGRLMQYNSPKANYTFRNQLNYQGTIASNHNITAIGGFEMREQNTPPVSQSLYFGYNPTTLAFVTLDEKTLLSPGYKSVMYGNNQIISTGKSLLAATLNRYVSFYGAAGYTYKNLYNISGSARVDQTNLFGTDPKYRYRPLWSVGASWNINNEQFMKDVNWVDLLALRGSYGVTGNVDQTSSPLPTASGGTYNTYTQPIPYLAMFTAPNPLLRWEKTSSYSGGVDFVLFKQLLSGKIEGYYKYCTDLLATKTLSYATGYASAKFNNGSMSDKGFEVTLSSPWFKHAGWTLTSTVIYGYNKNKIEKITLNPTSSEQLIKLPGSYFLEGVSYPAVYAYRYEGLYSGGTDYQNGMAIIVDEKGTPLYTTDPTTGTITYASSSSVKPPAAKYMGTSTPIWTGSFTQGVSYKGLELNAMLSFAGGHKVRKPSYNISTVRGSTTPFPANAPDMVRNAWTPTNTNTDVPKTAYYYSKTGQTALPYVMDYWRYSDVNVVSGDFIRLRNIALSYTMPQQWLRSTRLERVKITAQADNIWMASKAGDGIDPETRTGTSLDWTLPIKPAYLLRLEIGF